MLIQEEMLEPVARYVRFSKGIQHIPTTHPLLLVDLGCGPHIRFYHFAKKKAVSFSRYVGIDPLANEQAVTQYSNHPEVSILRHTLEKDIPIESNSVDVVTAFAFFEHIDHPQHILADSYRIVKPGGIIVLTVPSPRAQKVLEFLSYSLGIISPREIQEHKRYYNQHSLTEMLPKDVRTKQVHHSYFEVGMNNLLVIHK